MTHRSTLAALVVAIGLIAAACGDSDVGSSTSTIAAETETTTTTEAAATTSTEATTTTAAAAPEPEFPGRIISLSPSSTELLFAIGAGDQVIAVDEFSYFPDEAPVTDLSGFAPNLEAILAFEPDLLVWQGGPTTSSVVSKAPACRL
ncbi:MAG: ABC transporter substrate-binding protein [Actinobacteria bacterium]|nr:ABC transporter substrate-binding protein [Actinomycetota bacterium]